MESHTIHTSCPHFPVFGSPSATLEAVRNTRNLSSEKAGVGALRKSKIRTVLRTVETSTTSYFDVFRQSRSAAYVVESIKYSERVKVAL
jgi:hypothetical protein